MMKNFLIFSSEVDDRGIDFVARREDGKHFDVQVKTITGNNYTFVKESKFSSALLVCLIVLRESRPPAAYLFTRSDWDSPTDGLLEKHSFPNASEAEFGIHLAEKRAEVLAKFELRARLSQLP
ncbi:MAG: hypothetical protein PHH47_02190 [Gallionella sp.]|nr:hypothetical protein [Gallionella sp.]MDD4946356.1 hypothetical protein [Gallionella sp.]MDD5612232.1 hypothetical protein [Gallionella sp.]